MVGMDDLGPDPETNLQSEDHIRTSLMFLSSFVGGKLVHISIDTTII
jgi:hypothetical protein